MSRRELKKEATRQEILTSAAELFRTKGFEATSVDDIALSADVAKGTFYYHFKAKEDLVFALQEKELNIAFAKVEERINNDESPLTILFDFLKDMAHWAQANPELERVMFRKKFEMISQQNEECRGDDTLQPSKQFFINIIVDLLSAAQEKKEIRCDIEAAELARVLIPVVMSARMHWQMDPSQGTLPERIEKSLKLMLEGLGSQK